jgi:hypothetical protein
MNSPLGRTVLSGLRCHWSPQQIASTLTRMNNASTDQAVPRVALSVSHETIYCAIYAMPRGTLRTELVELLLQRADGDERHGDPAGRRPGWHAGGGDVATSLENKANAKVAQDQQALADAQASGDPASIAQAQANLGSDQQQAALWGNDGAARIASHAAVAALGGGSVEGAVGGTVAGDVAGNAVGGATGSTLLGNIAAGAAGAAGAVAGGALGGSAGALSGANGALSADLFNRQLHPEERTLIANAANEIAAS